MSETAGVVVRPPILFLVCLAVGVLLEWAPPSTRLGNPWLWALGFVLIAGGTALAGTAARRLMSTYPGLADLIADASLPLLLTDCVL